jgi:hypothetical protein
MTYNEARRLIEQGGVYVKPLSGTVVVESSVPLEQAGEFTRIRDPDAILHGQFDAIWRIGKRRFYRIISEGKREDTLA